MSRVSSANVQLLMEEFQTPLLRFAKSNNEKTEAYLKELSQRNQELEKLIRDHLHTAR